MIRECFKTETGIMFSSEAMKTAGIDPAMLYPIVQNRPAPLSAIGAQIQNIPSKAELKVMLKEAEEANSLVQVANVKTEEEHELLDALSPIYDQLSLVWYTWWWLELLPMKQHYQRSDNTWGTTTAWNLGRGRFIPKQKKKVIKVHRSVKLRMDAQHINGKKYVPAASFQRALDLGNIEWVD